MRTAGDAFLRHERSGQTLAASTRRRSSSQVEASSVSQMAAFPDGCRGTPEAVRPSCCHALLPTSDNVPIAEAALHPPEGVVPSCSHPRHPTADDVLLADGAFFPSEEALPSCSLALRPTRRATSRSRGRRPGARRSAAFVLPRAASDRQTTSSAPKHPSFRPKSRVTRAPMCGFTRKQHGFAPRTWCPRVKQRAPRTKQAC
jgi:hypothetical protein